jgi:hypothetical protein
LTGVLVIENEQGNYRLASADSRRQCRIVRKPKVTAEPEDRRHAKLSMLERGVGRRGQ